MITFLIEAVKSRIPNACDTTLVWVQTNGIAGGIFHCGKLLRICDDLLNERAVVVLFFVHNLAVHNATLCKSLTDCNRVNIIQTVIFLLGVELTNHSISNAFIIFVV